MCESHNCPMSVWYVFAYLLWWHWWLEQGAIKIEEAYLHGLPFLFNFHSASNMFAHVHVLRSVVTKVRPSSTTSYTQGTRCRSRYSSQPTSPLPDFSKTSRWGATLQVSPWQIPHSSKAGKGGEDTYFVSSDVSSFGVFDGNQASFVLTDFQRGGRLGQQGHWSKRL